ncbi:Uncharacterised protein [uncultured Ruminococcus sp.]|nr:Uncharacterised protein [uncultured Ruminococcus sp.]
MADRREQTESAQCGNQQRHRDVQHLLHFRSAIQIRGLDDLRGNTLHKEFDNQHIKRAAEGRHNVDPEGVQQVQVAHEQVGGNGAAAEDHGDDEVNHKPSAAGHLLVGEHIAAGHRQQQSCRNAE